MSDNYVGTHSALSHYVELGLTKPLCGAAARGAFVSEWPENVRCSACRAHPDFPGRVGQ